MCSCVHTLTHTYQPQWPRGLRRGSAAAGMLGLQVRIWNISFVSVVCRPVEVASTGWSLVQMSPAELCVCDRKASITRSHRPTRGCCAVEKNRHARTHTHTQFVYCDVSAKLSLETCCHLLLLLLLLLLLFFWVSKSCPFPRILLVVDFPPGTSEVFPLFHVSLSF